MERSSRMSRKKIMVIETYGRSFNKLKKRLEDLGHKVLGPAEDIKAAEAWAQRERPDLVMSPLSLQDKIK
ncbi:MAG: hypothetical protein V1742_09420, partial [Pseudomonadota bacterium]